MDLEAFFKMTYGLYMISSKDEKRISGYIANTAFQVTAEPPQIAISCHKDNTSAGVIERSKVFSISVLEKDTDAGLIGLFGYQSGNEEEKFDRVNYKIGETGAPVILTHSLAYFECEVVDKVDVGSHFLFIGAVKQGELLEADKDPLTYAYFRDEMKLMAPERAPTYVDKDKIKKYNTESNKTEAKDIGPNYICPICAYVYDPAIGDETQNIPPGTPFGDLPEDWICPICAAAKSMFIIEN
jgi:flavin reductase (DIM6/NTAB) family NADH-FMN oxidoreductase RutF/rubredoxin